MQKNILYHMRSFGLNSYEAKLWAALLSKGVSTAGELAEISNVPRSRSYDVLESLEKKGFVMMKLGKPIKYVAIKPTDALQRVKKRIMDNAETKTRLLEEFESEGLLGELNLIYKNNVERINPAELSSVFKGRDGFYSHLENIFKKAEKSITIMTTSTGFQRKSEYFKNAFKKAKERGVKIRIAAPVSDSVFDDAKKLSEFAEIRNTNTNSRFCIVDDKYTTFMLLDDRNTHPNFDTGIHIKTPFFASMFESFFNSIWASAEKPNNLGNHGNPGKHNNSGKHSNPDKQTTKKIVVKTRV